MLMATDHPTMLDAQILGALMRARHPVVPQALCEVLDQPLARVMAALNRVSAAGCDLAVDASAAVRLLSTDLGVWRDYLRSVTCPQRIIEVYRCTTSTQDAVRRLICSHGVGADGAVVVADEQTAGRGRMGRRWFAPRGTAVMFSRAWIGQTLEAQWSVDRLLLATTVAVSDALVAISRPHPLDVRIKWPNDLFVDGRKLAGILIETFPIPGVSHLRAVVIGVGINVLLNKDQVSPNALDLFDEVTSLAMCGRAVDRLLVLVEVLQRLDQTLEQDDFGPLVDRWRQRSILLSHHVRFQHDGRVLRGQVVDLDPHDGLIVRTDGGVIVHLSGAVTTML